MHYMIYIQGRCPLSKRRMTGVMEGFFSKDSLAPCGNNGQIFTVSDWRYALRMTKDQAVKECAALCVAGYSANIEPMSEASEKSARNFTGHDDHYYMDP